MNFFQPSMKLTMKSRDGSRVRKRYDIAQTPYQRLSKPDALKKDVRERLDALYRQLDPVELLRQLEKLQDAFWRHAKELQPTRVPAEVLRATPLSDNFAPSGQDRQRATYFRPNSNSPSWSNEKSAGIGEPTSHACRIPGALDPTRSTVCGRKCNHGLNLNLSGRQSRFLSNFSNETPPAIPTASYGPCSAACVNGGVKFW